MIDPGACTRWSDMAHWWPRLERIGVPVPRTRLIHLAGPDRLHRLLDGQDPGPTLAYLMEQIGLAAAALGGFPLFLRTGHLSAKHDWTETCYLPNLSGLAARIAKLVEASALADLFGLPTDTWAVRQFLDLDAPFTAFRGMPVAWERRFFIGGGGIECSHPYWPFRALQAGAPSDESWREALIAQSVRWPEQAPAVLPIVGRVAEAFSGRWSVDVARDRQGTWWVLDMARAEVSYHWDGCVEVARRRSHQAFERVYRHGGGR